MKWPGCCWSGEWRCKSTNSGTFIYELGTFIYELGTFRSDSYMNGPEWVVFPYSFHIISYITIYECNDSPTVDFCSFHIWNGFHFIHEMGPISYMKWFPFIYEMGTYKRLFIWHLTTKLGKVCQFRWGWATVIRSSYARSALFWILGDGYSSQFHSRTPLSQARAPKLLGNWVSSRTNSIASINQLVAMDDLKCSGNIIIVQLGMINSPVGNEWFPVGNWIVPVEWTLAQREMDYPRSEVSYFPGWSSNSRGPNRAVAAGWAFPGYQKWFPKVHKHSWNEQSLTMFKLCWKRSFFLWPQLCKTYQQGCLT